MTDIDLSQFKTGDEIVVTVELKTKVVEDRRAKELVLSSFSLLGESTRLWKDGKVTDMPSGCLNVVSVEKYVRPLPTEPGTIVKSVNGCLYALNASGTNWIGLSGTFNVRAADMQERYARGSVEVVR